MLEQFVRNLPRWLLVSVALIGGLMFFMLVDPPHTICNTQLEIFHESLAGHIFPKQEKSINREPKYAQLVSRCKETNSPGGCYELFLTLRFLLEELKKIPTSCASEVAEINEVKSILIFVPTLMSQLAWGDQPPKSYLDKQGWLASSEMALFCDIKQIFLIYYGKAKWAELQEKLFNSLPGSTTMVRQKIWERMIMSSRCEQWQH